MRQGAQNVMYLEIIKHCNLQSYPLSYNIPYAHDMITHSSNFKEIHGWKLPYKSVSKRFI